MSQSLLTYSGITTKSRAMESKFFDEKAYDDIMQSSCVREFVQYLKATDVYHPYFEHINENNVHRGQVEKILKTSLYQNFQRLYQFANKEQRQQLELVYFRYEIAMLSDCLKKTYNPETEVDDVTFKTVLKNHINIPIELLLNAHSLEEFCSFLKGTPYEKVFTMFLHEDQPSLFELLMHLNNFYYKSIWKKKDKVFNKQQNISFTKCMGTKIDVQNIMNIFRCKKYYQVDDAKILSILIPITYRLKKEQLNELIHANSINEFVFHLQKTDYAINKEVITQDDMEREYYNRISHAYEESKCKSPISMAPIFSYLYHKERELDNLTTILEGIRYEMKQDKIKEYLMN